MAKKKIKHKAVVGGPIIWKNLIKNWLHQGITYMDVNELVMRMVIEFFEIFLINFFVSKMVSSSVYSFMISFFIAHTYNWVTNGNFWALAIFAFPHLRNQGEMSTCTYLQKLTSRLQTHTSIGGVLIFGSISRSVWHDRSDIDMRFFRKPGLKNLLIAGFLTMRERFLAFLYRQPLDLFLSDSIISLRKMRDDEKPVFLIKRDIRLDKEFPHNNPRNIIFLNSN